MEEAKTPRTVSQIKHEYSLLCAQIGQRQYDMEYAQQEIKKGLVRLSELHQEMKQHEEATKLKEEEPNEAARRSNKTQGRGRKSA